MVGPLGKSANQILIRISGDSKQLVQELNKADSAVEMFAARVKLSGPLIGAAFTAAASYLTTYAVNSAMTYERLERGFHNLAANQGKDADTYLKQLKEVSHGTVSELDLMAKANQAMLLGIDLDTLVAMLEGATVIAQATGQNADYMFESIALGVARMSPKILDNLGIIIDVDRANQKYAESLGITVEQLTQVEQSTAFMNAAMDGLKDRTRALGGYTEDTRSEWDKTKITFGQISTVLGEDLLPPLNSALTSLNNWLDSGNADRLTDAFRQIGENMMFFFNPLGGLFDAYREEYQRRYQARFPQDDLEQTLDDALFGGDPGKKGEEAGAQFGAGFKKGMSNAMRAAEKGVSRSEFAMGGTIGGRVGYLSPDEFAAKYDTEFAKQLKLHYAAIRSGV